MKTLIASDATEGHIISKYSFKVLAFGGQPSTKEEASVLVDPSEALGDDAVAEVDGSGETGAVTEPSGSRDDLVESLLKKTDDISSNFIKMQMKLEAVEAEHK